MRGNWLNGSLASTVAWPSLPSSSRKSRVTSIGSALGSPQEGCTGSTRRSIAMPGERRTS